MGTRTVQSLDRALDILEELAQSRKPLGLSELAREVSLSKTTVHRLLQTLLERGYVEKVQSGKYVIGPTMFNTLSYHINTLELQAEAKPHLHALQNLLGLTVSLGVLNGPFVSLIEREATNQSSDIFNHVGRQLPVHCSSMGKCLLSCLSNDELEEALYGFELSRRTEHTITSKSQLRMHLREVRRQGWAIDNEESELNHRCISSPVYNYRGDAVAVLGVSGTADELPEDRIDYIAQQVVHAAGRTSASLGYVG